MPINIDFRGMASIMWQGFRGFERNMTGFNFFFYFLIVKVNDLFIDIRSKYLNSKPISLKVNYTHLLKVFK